MKLLKPSWVHHDEKPIFSIDVHQGCLKFATGGQGADSGRVVIWNLLPVLSEKAELDDTVPKMLCQMDNHLSCVNCVRWSQSGLMLSSCSDDKLVMIWRQSQGQSGIFGTGGIQKNPETWKCVFTLRGHSGDVLDLAWSPQDRWLASCSIDNTIIVWDVQNFPVIVATLRGHTGLVKGVAWDPVGKYLASQSDDRSVKIWKTADWACSSTIKEPFEECGGTTHILRLSWSPDGQYLVSAHAMNGGGPTAQIIEREGWKCDKDFVGHRKAVTCVRFHTSILKRQAPKTQKPQQYCCLAVGSRDRSLSVWMTALQRPLVVIHELFSDSILDLSWGPEKCILMACSGDGSVACLQFSENELGTPLSEEDRNALYQRIYGKTAANLTNGTSATTDVLIENPELLSYTQDKMKPPTLPTIQIVNHNNNNNNNCIETTGSLPSSNGFCHDNTISTPNFSANTSMSSGGQSTPMKAINQQMETRTKDGKRRITPVFIPLNSDVVETTTPITNAIDNNLNSFPRPSIGGTEIQNETSVVQPIGQATEATAIATREIANESSNHPTANMSETEQGRLDSRLVKSATKRLVEPFTVRQDSFQEFPQFKRVPQHLPDSVVGGSGDTSTPATSSSSSSTALSKVYQASTAGPRISINASTKCEFQKTALNYRVHVHNGCVQTATGPLAKVTAFRLPTGKLWETYVGSAIVNFNFCKKCVMLCSLDGSLRLLDLHTGSPLMPMITLTTAAVQCAFCPKGLLVGVITDCGLLRIWNIDSCSSMLATTCSDIFGKHGSIYQFTITEHGVPLIIFANGHAYSYSPKMQSWLVLNTKDPITRHGLKSSIPKEFPRNYLTYPLMSVQASTNLFSTTSAGIELNANDWQAVAKLSFIENQIKICESINSPEEFKHWYSMLVYQLAIGGDEKKLRLLLNDLLSTATQSSYADSQKVNITKHSLDITNNITKHSLVEKTLEQLKLHPRWQRIYMEYNELYEDIKSRSKQQEKDKSVSLLVDKSEGKGCIMEKTRSTPGLISKTNDIMAQISSKLEDRMDIT